MNYVNAVTGKSSSVNSDQLFFLRYSPVNPYEAPDEEGNYSSGTIDIFYAIQDNYLVSAGAGNSLTEGTRVEPGSKAHVTEGGVEYVRVTLTKKLIDSVQPGTPFLLHPKVNVGNKSKFGFDKIPVPTRSRNVPLYDIVTNKKLLDSSNRELITEAEQSVARVASSDLATSAIINPNAIEPITIQNQFPQTSEVSTTLLGTNRAETQLSLFSDVSVLGFDEDYWEVFTFRRPGRQFSPWDNRNTRDFGNHYDARMIEVTDEQAIQIGAFPTPYVYPFGPRWDNQNLYNNVLYQLYKNFITLGNILFTYYSESGLIDLTDDKGRPFRELFLDGSKVYLDGDDVVFDGITDAEAYTLIDTWTRTWVDIRTNTLINPQSGNVFSSTFVDSIVGNPTFEDTRPGYESAWQRYGYMQSRKAYRYQPGRISGFTFGARASVDSGDASNTIEWGISNPTDEYVFQVRGAQFNIVRRSTVALDPDVVRAQGLEADDQTFEPKGDPFDIDEDTGELRNYYTTVIPRDLFNGDRLDGNGPSGYALGPDRVTMYKIEFGWYGAIGAKFYAYIPVGNGEARWVLIHTLVIENKLGEPCLADPYFRFKYTLNIQEASTVKTPQFIYKYGASCYIDGGDDGTVVQRSYRSGVRTVNANNEKALMGIYPKTEIVNDVGFVKKNKKSIFPKSASFTASELTKIEIVTCRACPGFAHNYNHGLQSNESGRVVNIKVLSDRQTIEIVTPDEYFTVDDIGSKIITDGIWSSYIKEVLNETGTQTGLFRQATIERMNSGDYIKTNEALPNIVYSRTNEELFTIPTNGTVYPFPVRLTRYDAVAGSTIPLTAPKIDIQFLNPSVREDDAHFAEYLLGVTDKKPLQYFDEELDDVVFGWEFEEGNQTELPLENILFAEVTQSTTRRNRDGYEIGEANYPVEYVGELDYRIPEPLGGDSGVCSKFTVQVQDRIGYEVEYTNINPSTGNVDGGNYLTRTNQSFSIEGLKGGEIGILSGSDYISSGVRFTTNEQPPVESGNDLIYYAEISDSLGTAGQTLNIQLTPVRFFGRHVDKTKIFNFNPYPLYLVCKMRDNSVVNSISIKEEAGLTNVSFTPKWLFNDKVSLVNTNSVDDLPPVNFVSEVRTDSATIDTQLEQKLRPYEILDTFYVGQNETKVVDLTNIYGADREEITPDLFNLEATFFTGKTMTASDGTIQISLNTAEQ